jgi:hypothetical protein
MVKQTTKRAPVDGVDAKITAAVARRDALCRQMAAGQDVLAELVEATNEVTALQFERGEIIRDTFNRKGSR